MSETCGHDCSACEEDCESREVDFSVKLNDGSRVKKTLAIMSGKGGVGKSMVTSLLASEMARRGKNAAVLDADITGPSIPRMFGIDEPAGGTETVLYPNKSKSGVKIMSMNLLLPEDNDPVVWRGPILAGVVKQFWSEVEWGDIDFMFVDMPPGTGDVPLTVFQSLPVDGIVVVTSPQDMVGMIVEKAIKMANMMEIPILALVENMSFFRCPDCGEEHEIFGRSHLEEIAEKYNIKIACRLPIDPEIAKAADEGEIEFIKEAGLKDLTDALEKM